MVLLASILLTINATNGRRHTNRIINGTEAQPGEFPFAVQLAVNGSVVCAGSILTDRFVLTAAHCVYRKQPQDVTIRVGCHQFWNCTGDYSVQRLVWHRNYNRPLLTPNLYDIALLMTSKPIVFNKEPGFGCVYKVDFTKDLINDVAIRRKMTVVGWGQTERGPFSEVLRKAEVTLVVPKVCLRSWNERGLMVCARDSNVYPFKGDSGAPLLKRHPDWGYWIQAGIESHGSRRPGEFTEFTRIGYYYKWLTDQMQQWEAQNRLGRGPQANEGPFRGGHFDEDYL